MYFSGLFIEFHHVAAIGICHQLARLVGKRNTFLRRKMSRFVSDNAGIPHGSNHERMSGSTLPTFRVNILGPPQSVHVQDTYYPSHLALAITGMEAVN
jgi:hypothetical protein